MKKNVFYMTAAAVLLCFICTACTPKAKKDELTIGIAKIVAHPALDSVEKGIQDYLTENGVKAVYDLQNANGDLNTAAQIAQKYKAAKIDVAVGIATPVAVALANTIKDVPVIFATITDPVGAGLVTSLDKGENNVTGLSDAIPTVEHIKLFAQIANLKTLGYIYTSSEANSVSSLNLVKKGCEQAGIQLVTQSITNSSEVKQAAESIINRVDGLYLTTDNTVFSALASLVQVFGKAAKPIFSGDVTGAMDGGCFMASGFNYYKAGRATGKIVKDVLDGKKPADIPVQFITDPAESDILIDFDAARACGITIPESLINSASMIYENGKLTRK